MPTHKKSLRKEKAMIILADEALYTTWEAENMEKFITIFKKQMQLTLDFPILFKGSNDMTNSLGQKLRAV